MKLPALFAWLGLTLTSVPALAQSPPASFGVEGAGGYAGVADDAIIGHSLVGGAARWRVAPRVWIGPEITYMKGEGEHSDLMLTGNVTLDLLERRAGRQAIPYLLVGGGLFQSRDTFGSDTFTSSEGAFTAGGGVRVLLTDALYVAPEFRGGWEPHFRLSVSVGYSRGWGLGLGHSAVGVGHLSIYPSLVRLSGRTRRFTCDISSTAWRRWSF